MDSDKLVTANFFVGAFSLTTTVNGQGSIEPANGSYPVGAVITLIAIPVDGWNFVSWSGAISSTENPLLLTINSDKLVTANPTAGSYSIVWKYANGRGTDRTAQLMENGSTRISSISMPSTGSWTSWAETSAINVNLSAGTLLVRLQATNSYGLSNIDYMTISDGSISAASCVGLKNAQESTEISKTDSEMDVKLYPNPVSNALNI